MTWYTDIMCTELPEKTSEEENSSAFPPEKNKERIHTQIHRRKKANAVLPMENEWDDQSNVPPRLRTPSSKMKKSYDVS